jgi:hypothetical protein
MSKYSIIFTKGNEEILVGECDTLDKAKEAIKELNKETRYKDGLLTIEKDGRIY